MSDLFNAAENGCSRCDIFRQCIQKFIAPGENISGYSYKIRNEFKDESRLLVWRPDKSVSFTISINQITGEAAVSIMCILCNAIYKTNIDR